MSIDDVYKIFIDFYGEDKVDLHLQESDIIVWFPEVTVTNENNRSIKIYDLYAKVSVDLNGKLLNNFQLIRTTYTPEQLYVGYLHSHTPSLSMRLISEWKHPCLGYGPIRDTLASLFVNPSEDLWKLFCLELSLYVKTESLSGGPYVRLESVGTKTEEEYNTNFVYDPNSKLSPVQKGITSKFIPYIIQQRPFNFNIAGGCYRIADTNFNIAVILSNLFIKWYNELPQKERLSYENLLENSILVEVRQSGHDFYIDKRDSVFSTYGSLKGKKVLTFKGEDKLLSVIREKKDTTNVIRLLSKKLIEELVFKLLFIINRYYGKANNEDRKIVWCL